MVVVKGPCIWEGQIEEDQMNRGIIGDLPARNDLFRNGGSKERQWEHALCTSDQRILPWSLRGYVSEDPDP